MICREVTEFLIEYEAGSLDPAVLSEFERHLGRCADCRIFIVQYQETIKAGRQACAEQHADAKTEIPEELLRAIMVAIGKVERT